MPNILISKADRILRGTVRLPGSKSESNRALIMQALCGEGLEILNLSEAEDTLTLKRLLEQRENQHVLDVGPAGTAMRFLTAYCAVTEGEWVLTGSQRMKERPIGPLADALKALGAEIGFPEKAGFPPMTIRGKSLDAAAGVSIPGNISSQYISALLMIAPVLPQGLRIRLEGEIASRPYIEMTLSMMAEAGIRHEWKGQEIHVPSQPYLPATLRIEPDWSGASYWYSLAALCEEVDLEIPFLKESSLQGDRAIAAIMRQFGVETHFTEEGIRLSKCPWEKGLKRLDFIHCPDLAQTVIACAAALGQPLEMTGLESLKIKETDRVAALRNELGKFGALLEENPEGNRWTLDPGKVAAPAQPPFIHTYHDHRMAMAMAPLAVALGPMHIEDRDVVGKSYPGFWKDLSKVGFELQESTIEV